jgi:hypothetical protein
MRVLVALLFVTLAGGACGSSTLDASGTYTMSITDEDNGCGFQGWTTGAVATDIPLIVTQTGANVSAQISGAVGSYVQLLLGVNTFTGDIGGDELNLTLTSTNAAHQGNCAYFVNGDVVGKLTGDALQGTIVYTTTTNKSPDCGAVEGCHSTQAFSGNRPPAAK